MFIQVPPEPPVAYCLEAEDNCIGSYIQSEDGTIYRIVAQGAELEHQQLNIADLDPDLPWIALAIPDEVDEFISMHTQWCVQVPNAPSCG